MSNSVDGVKRQTEVSADRKYGAGPELTCRKEITTASKVAVAVSESYSRACDRSKTVCHDPDGSECLVHAVLQFVLRLCPISRRSGLITMGESAFLPVVATVTAWSKPAIRHLALTREGRQMVSESRPTALPAVIESGGPIHQAVVVRRKLAMCSSQGRHVLQWVATAAATSGGNCP